MRSGSVRNGPSFLVSTSCGCPVTVCAYSIAIVSLSRMNRPAAKVSAILVKL